VQTEVLAKYPEANLRVYAIWLDVLWSDSRARWRSDLLADRRVTHFWDVDSEAGRWFFQHVTRREGADVEWDGYCVYPASARWESVPSPLLRWGRTVLGDREGLQGALLPLLETAPESRR